MIDASCAARGDCYAYASVCLYHMCFYRASRAQVVLVPVVHHAFDSIYECCSLHGPVEDARVWQGRRYHTRKRQCTVSHATTPAGSPYEQ